MRKTNGPQMNTEEHRSRTKNPSVFICVYLWLKRVFQQPAGMRRELEAPSGKRKKNWPPMNTDEHRSRTKNPSVFICVHLWLKRLFPQPAGMRRARSGQATLEFALLYAGVMLP